MNEEEARSWIEDRYGAAAGDRVARFLARVVTENSRQNLISPASVQSIWVRHAMDSAQLVPLAKPGHWIDIGSGAGFPGMVVALLRDDLVTLVEPRRMRAAFLQACAEELEAQNIRISASRIETVQGSAANISARAVASVEKLLHMAAGCATTETRWLLPRGRLDEQELEAVRRSWRGLFHVEQSLTDPNSSILVLDEVSRR